MTSEHGDIGADAPRLGFIGLGQMGAPMAANIARAGFELAVFDKAGTAARAPAARNTEAHKRAIAAAAGAKNGIPKV